MKKVMTRAWKIFRTLVGDYTAKIKMALRMAWAELKNGGKKMEDTEKQNKAAETTETIEIEENTLTINGESTKIVYKNEKHGIYITEVAAKELDIRNGKRYGKFLYTHVDKESCADFTEEIRSEYRNASENIIKNDLASTIQNFISQIDLETFEIGECKNRTLWREHGRKYLTSKVIKTLKDICAKYNTYEKIKAFNDAEKAAKAEYERKNFYKGQKIDKTYGGDFLFECMECGKIFTSRYHNAKCRCCGESTQSEWVKEIDWE